MTLGIMISGCESHKLLSDGTARAELCSATTDRNASIALSNGEVQTGRFVSVEPDSIHWVNPDDRSLPKMISASHVTYSSLSSDRFLTCYGLDDQTELCGMLLAIRKDTAYLRLIDSMRRIVPTRAVYSITVRTPKTLVGAGIGAAVGFFASLIAASAAPTPSVTDLGSFLAAATTAWFSGIFIVAGTITGSLIGAIIGSEAYTVYSMPADTSKAWTHIPPAPLNATPPGLVRRQ